MKKHRFQYHAKEYISITKHESHQTSTGTKQTLFKLEGAPCLVTLALLVEEGNSCVYFEGTYQTEMLPEMSRTKPAQGQKNTSFELQSAPNLHRDKKTQVLNFKVHQTCTGTKKKTKVLNFKVHQTCTGTKKTKKNKNFPIYLGRGKYPSKVFVFFVCPCAGLVHFEVQNCCFFCPCAGLVHFEVQNFCFFCPCAGLVHFEVQNLCFFVPVEVWCTLKFKTQCNCSFLL